MALVFVYGTLMRAGANHAVLRRLGARFVALAETREPRTLVDLGPYPALLPRSRGGPCPVRGEVWELSDDALRELDVFEGHPDLYSRELVALAPSGAPAEAFVYVLAAAPPPHARAIADGRYACAGAVLPDGVAAEQFATPSR